MLKKLVTKSFRKLNDHTVTFADGLHVLKAPNEGGKSTTIEAILYALFGSGVLRTNFEDAVTWGNKPNDLSVTLDICVAGENYTFKRSKGGAEVTYKGNVYVTGQKEVALFAEKLLGVDAKTASKLMLAAQGDLRGALSQGPKATMDLISNLADFNVLDRLLETAQAKLLTGSPDPFVLKMQDAEAMLATAEAVAIVSPKCVQESLAFRDAKSAELQAAITTTLQPAADAAALAFNQAAVICQARQTIESDIKRAEAEVAKTQVDHDDFALRAKDRKDVAEIEAKRQELLDAEGAAKLRQIKAKFDALPAFPDLHWTGGVQDYAQEVTATWERIREAELAVVKNEGEIARLKETIVSGSVCGFCNQDVSQFPDVAAKNGVTTEKIARLQNDTALLGAQLRGDKDTYAQLKEVAKLALPFEQFASAHPAYVEIEYGTHPFRLTWGGPVVGTEAQSPEVLRKFISQAEEYNRQADKAGARAEGLADTLARLTADIGRLQQRLNDTPEVVGLSELTETYTNTTAALAEANQQLEQAKDHIGKLRVELAQIEAAIAQRDKSIADATARIAEIRKDIDSLHFANDLIKRIKQVRPLVADKLWNQILTSVSTFFSAMRGEKSVVAKGKDGFVVNGQAVEGLSGSTLDVLALAIRVSLMRTFLPHVPFLVLDEPFAACDVTRTSAALGFLAGAGFNQILLASHDELSESFADGLVTL